MGCNWVANSNLFFASLPLTLNECSIVGETSWGHHHHHHHHHQQSGKEPEGWLAGPLSPQLDNLTKLTLNTRGLTPKLFCWLPKHLVELDVFTTPHAMSVEDLKMLPPSLHRFSCSFTIPTASMWLGSLPRTLKDLILPSCVAMGADMANAPKLQKLKLASIFIDGPLQLDLLPKSLRFLDAVVSIAGHSPGQQINPAVYEVGEPFLPPYLAHTSHLGFFNPIMAVRRQRLLIIHTALTNAVTTEVQEMETSLAQKIQSFEASRSQSSTYCNIL